MGAGMQSSVCQPRFRSISPVPIIVHKKSYTFYIYMDFSVIKKQRKMSNVRLLKAYNTNNALVQLAACKLENHSFLVQYAEVDLCIYNVLVCHLLQKFVTEMHERSFNTDSD